MSKLTKSNKVLEHWQPVLSKLKPLTDKLNVKNFNGITIPPYKEMLGKYNPNIDTDGKDCRAGMQVGYMFMIMMKAAAEGRDPDDLYDEINGNIRKKDYAYYTT